MRRSAVAVALSMLFMVAAGGCATPAPVVRPEAPPAATTASSEGSAAVSIPALKFVSASSVPDGDAVKPGSKLPAGVTTLQTGEHITSTRWFTGNVNGEQQSQIALAFDPEGTAALAAWSREAVGKRVLVVLGDRVLASFVVAMPLEQGSVSLAGPEVLAARSEIQSAAIPAK